MIEKLSFPDCITDKQAETLNSVKQIDDKGFLYEINYTADYKLDDVISACKTGYDLDCAVSNVLLPDGPYKLEFKASELGCSCFCTLNNEKQPILARNYDFFNTNHICAVCRTNSISGYSFIGALDLFFFGIRENNLNEPEKRIQLLYSPFQIQDGINEKGFACAIQMLFEGKTVQKRNKKPVLSTLVANLLLNKASSVKEATEILNSYDMVAFFDDIDYNHKWIMCDASGDMAVIEYTDEKMNIIRPKKNCIASANYYLSKPIQTQIGKGFLRVATLNNFLNLNPHPTDALAMKYLETVSYTKHLDYTDSDILGRNDKEDDITYWSEIFNTEKRTMDFVFKENYSKIYRFEL